MAKLTILVYGDTGDGKTALGGELMEHIYTTEKKKSRLYSADRGGWKTIQPYVTLGVCEAIPLSGDPWLWINRCAKGMVPDAKGQWVPGIRDDVGLYMFEGISSISDHVMTWMAQASGRGVNIGGGGAFNFKTGESKEALTIGTNNMGHYTVAQQRVLEEVWNSQALPGIVLWTASARRANDADTQGTVLGIQAAGKALTSEIPRWFEYTFRVAAIPQMGKESRHILYLEDHVDQTAAMAKGLGNPRTPLAGGKAVTVPFSIEPASLVQAIKVLDKRQDAATDEIAARLGIKRT